MFYVGWKKKKINFDFVNKNPSENNTSYADFSKKFYFNILLDDKAFFEPSDWVEISEWIKTRELNKLK